MAFNKAPSHWISGYTFDGTNLSIPLAALTGLSSGSANATTGDIREIIQKFQEAMWQKWVSEGSGNTPVEMTLFAPVVSTNSTTSVVTRTYQAQYLGTTGTFSIASEP
jgi:hypothetical protein